LKSATAGGGNKKRRRAFAQFGAKFEYSTSLTKIKSCQMRDNNVSSIFNAESSSLSKDRRRKTGVRIFAFLMLDRSITLFSAPQPGTDHQQKIDWRQNEL
jgi:hypothetical protein